MRSFIQRPSDPNVVYAPHWYDPRVLWVYPYDGNEKRTLNALEEVALEAERMGVPWMLGEWGIILTTPGAEEYIRDHLKILDDLLASWFDSMSPLKADGSPRCADSFCLRDLLVRPQPLYIAGIPTQMTYDVEGKVFRLCFWDRDIPNRETSLRIPLEVYPSGFSVNVSDGNWEVEGDRLNYLPEVSETHHCITVSPLEK